MAKLKSTAADRRIAERIRRTRSLRGLSQTAMAHAIGVSFQQVQKYETGDNRITGGMLAKIAGVLGVSPGTFFDAPGPADESVPVLSLTPRLIRALAKVPAKHLPLMADMAEALGGGRE